MKYLSLILLFAVACNQSQKVEQAFVVMNKGLEELQDKTPAITIDSVKYAELYKQAKALKTKADSLSGFIYDIKVELIRAAEGDNAEEVIVNGKILLGNVINKDDYDTPTKIMVGEGGNKTRGKQLKNKLGLFKKYCQEAFATADRTRYADSLRIDVRDAKDPEEIEINTWEENIFYHTPLIAAIAHLSKLDNDVRHAEGVVIRYLNAQAK